MKHSYTKSFFVLGLGAMLSLSSCMDDLDFDKVDDLQFGPNVVVPILNATLTLSDVVASDSIFTIDPDGGLRIIYQNDSLFAFNATEFVDIPTQDPFGVQLATGMPPVALEVGLGTLGGIELATAEFFTGRLRWTINTAHNDSVVVRVTLTNATVPGGATFVVDLTSPSAGLDTGSVNMNGLLFDLSQSNQGAPPYNNFGFAFEVIKAKNAPLGTPVDISLQFADLGIEEATGYFGQRTVNIPANSFPLGLGQLEQFVNGFFLDNPTIRMDVINGIGLPLSLNLDMDGQNKNGNLAPLSAPVQTITAPASSGNVSNSALIWDRNNSNIVDFLGNVPNTIIYAGGAQTNPNGNTGTLNFISRNSFIQFGLTVDIPLEIRTQNLTIEQHIDNVDIGGENPEFLEELELYFTVTNGFPFDLDLDVIFVNSATNTPMDSITLSVLQAAAVDANGRVTAPNSYVTSFELNQSQVDNLLLADKWIIRGRLETTNGGTQTVKIFTDYSMNVKVGMRSKINYSLGNN